MSVPLNDSRHRGHPLNVVCPMDSHDASRRGVSGSITVSVLASQLGPWVPRPVKVALCAFISAVDEIIESASPADTRAEMLQYTGRGYLQLRHVLVQLPQADEAGSRASMLARFVHERKHRALLLYLLLLTCWPWLQKEDVPLQSDVWIRALTACGAVTWTPSTLSRAWADLEKLGLVAKKREQRLVRAVPRREDAREDYTAPAGRADRLHMYFTLPGEFWTDEVVAKLSLPALAMLLVIAKETNAKAEFRMTYANAEEWFGISARTARTGLGDLERLGLAYQRAQVVKAGLSPTGQTVHMWYSLTGPFSYSERTALQRRTAKARARRLRSTTDAGGGEEPAHVEAMGAPPTVLPLNTPQDFQAMMATFAAAGRKRP